MVTTILVLLLKGYRKMSKKLIVIECEYRKKKFLVFYGKEKLAEFSTKELANDFASIYFVPPYTMQSNVWYK